MGYLLIVNYYPILIYHLKAYEAWRKKARIQKYKSWKIKRSYVKYCLLDVTVISLNNELTAAMATCITPTEDQPSQHSSKLEERLMRLHQCLRCCWQLMISEGEGVIIGQNLSTCRFPMHQRMVSQPCACSGQS